MWEIRKIVVFLSTLRQIYTVKELFKVTNKLKRLLKMQNSENSPNNVDHIQTPIFLICYEGAWGSNCIDLLTW